MIQSARNNKKLNGYITFQDKGAALDGVTDDTAAVQATINAAQLTGASIHLTEGVARVTAPLNITARIEIEGEGCSPYAGAPAGNRGKGSWLFFDHTGIGLNINNAGNFISGVSLDGFGTFRTQPTPGPGWAPTAHDFDIYTNNADVLIGDLMLLNPTKGIGVYNGLAGRVSIGRLRGQPLQVGIYVDQSLDICSASQIHFWPFWQNNADVNAYIQSNLDAVYLARCDNPHFQSLFSYGARAGLRIGQNSFGTTRGLKIANADFDSARYGLWIDPSVSMIAQAQISNMQHQAAVGDPGSIAIRMQGSLSTVNISSFATNLCDQYGIRVEGTSNLLRLGNVTVANFNQAAGGFPAISVLNGNIVSIPTVPLMSGGGSGARYSTTGNIYVDEWRNYTPGVSAGSGALVAFAAAGQFKILESSAHYRASVAISNNGTGATNLQVQLPAVSSASAVPSVGGGVETSASTALNVYVPASSAYATVTNYNAAYPGANGKTICIQGVIPL